MDFYKSSSYIYKYNFPMRSKYLSSIGNYIKRLNKGFSFINNEFSILLKKNEVEKIEEEKKKQYQLMLKLLEEKKQRKINSEINRQKRIEMNKKITKSISNNNMLLNIMSNSKQFIKYLKDQKQSRNNNFLVMKTDSVKNNNLILKTQKNSSSSTFITEIQKFNLKNFSFNKNRKNTIKILKQKIPKFKLNSYLTLRKVKEKIMKPQKNKTMRSKNFSANNILEPKTVMIPRFINPKIKINFAINNKIRPNFIK